MPLRSVLDTKAPMVLVERVLAGDRLALARLLTLIENQEEDGFDALAALYPHTGGAHLIGVTGAPGTGKSTLVNRLVKQLREGGSSENGAPPSVGVVAVDPSSPFSGGAILGDRIRMRDLAGDSGVFIRSMASRGALGGLASATAGVAQALDAAGFEVILIETVGAGQAEVDIARTAHTTIVISAPGLGDEIQAIKAGIMEIADIMVVNKADLPGAENAVQMLRAMLEMSRSTNSDANAGERKSEYEWDVPVLSTISTQGQGIDTLRDTIVRHRNFLHDSGEWSVREMERMRDELDELLRQHLMNRFLASQPDGRYDDVLNRVLSRKISPWQAVKFMTEGEGR